MLIPTRVLGRTSLPVSVLGLGTAEIGFKYGVGEKILPNDSEAEALLRFCVAAGITYFDTAHLYQLSEERIGRSGILKNPTVLVGTKCGHFLEKREPLSSAEMETKIRAEVDESRKKLQIDTLPLLFLHGGSQVDIEKGEVLAILKKLKDEKKIKYTGISTRGEDAPLAAVKSGFFDVIQVAHSILDQRMEGRVLPAAQKANIGVVNRSVFLKGTLTSRRAHLPSELSALIKQADVAETIAQSLGITLPALAIRFALSSSAVATVLVGSAKTSHIEEALAAANAGLLPVEILTELHRLAIDIPKLVDPALWPPLN